MTSGVWPPEFSDLYVLSNCFFVTVTSGKDEARALVCVLHACACTGICAC